MTGPKIPGEICGAHVEQVSIWHDPVDLETRITVLIDTRDLQRLDLTRPITITQEDRP